MRSWWYFEWHSILVPLYCWRWGALGLAIEGRWLMSRHCCVNGMLNYSRWIWCWSVTWNGREKKAHFIQYPSTGKTVQPKKNWNSLWHLNFISFFPSIQFHFHFNPALFPPSLSSYFPQRQMLQWKTILHDYTEKRVINRGKQWNLYFSYTLTKRRENIETRGCLN